MSEPKDGARDDEHETWCDTVPWAGESDRKKRACNCKSISPAPQEDAHRWTLHAALLREFGDDRTPLEVLDSASTVLQALGYPSGKHLQTLRERLVDAINAETATDCSVCCRVHGLEVIHPCE